MADKKANHVPSLWEQLPKHEQERLKLLMATPNQVSQKRVAVNGNGGFKLVGYVRCELSVSDKQAYREWEPLHTDAECYAILVKLVDSGYLLKIGESGNGYQASLCAATTGRPWDGYVLVSHAGSGSRAAMLLVYKHEVLLNGDWEAFIDDNGEDSFR